MLSTAKSSLGSRSTSRPARAVAPSSTVCARLRPPWGTRWSPCPKGCGRRSPSACPRAGKTRSRRRCRDSRPNRARPFGRPATGGAAASAPSPWPARRARHTSASRPNRRAGRSPPPARSWPPGLSDAAIQLLGSLLMSEEDAPKQRRPIEIGAEAEPIKLGSMLLTLVEPHRGHEVAYNRWYERDHFYAGCMVGPYNFAGRRFVATADLKALRDPDPSAITGEPERGSYVAVYWVLDRYFDVWNRWALRQVDALHAARPMSTERAPQH